MAKRKKAISNQSTVIRKLNELNILGKLNHEIDRTDESNQIKQKD